MQLEIYLEGSDAAILHRCAERPDVVTLGSGQVFRFYRFREPKVGGNRAAAYRLATVADFPQIEARFGKNT